MVLSRMPDSETIPPTQMVDVARDLLVDTVIGERYRVLGRIGEGGMGTVFRVEHMHMKKVLALDSCAPSTAGCPMPHVASSVRPSRPADFAAQHNRHDRFWSWRGG